MTSTRSTVAFPVDPQTYRNLAYLLLSAPLGLAYFVFLASGAALSLGLSLTLLGPVAFLATLLVAVGLAWAETRLATGLLGVDVEAPGLPDADGAVAFVRELVFARTTWAGVGYLAWKALFGFVAFALLAVGGTTAASMVAAPLAYGDALAVNYRLGRYAVDSLPRALAVAGAGVLVGAVTLLLSNLLARCSGAVTAALFGGRDG